MTLTNDTLYGVDRIIALFPASSRKALEGLLERAREKGARQAERGVKAAIVAPNMPNFGMRRLTRELERALTHRGAPVGRASVKEVSLTTGGRSFHFAHTVVNKAKGAASALRQSGRAAGKGEESGKAAAHMAYLERDMAVERVIYPDEREAQGGEERQSRECRDGGVQRHERHAMESSPAGAASAGQGYVENQTKLEAIEANIFSFGTIGDHFQDRVGFWNALEQAETYPDAQVQHRLILELPHEASPAARLEIVKQFCRKFEEDEVPFWAVLHAPGPKNDARNFHAHVVYSERPAVRMAHPETGAIVWDFEIIQARRKKSRNLVKYRPFRQNKLRAYNNRHFVKGRREEFANIVNVILERDRVRDRLGRPVRYDPRSYAAMGIDAVPMRSINRVVADRARDGATMVVDADYTSRMIAAELREAALRRERSLRDVVALDEAMTAARSPRRTVSATDRLRAGTPPVKAPHSANGLPLLPLELRSPNLRSVPQEALKAAGDRVLAARQEAVCNPVIERAITTALERIVEATAPETIAATARGQARKGGPVAADAEAARVLHEAALEELATVRETAAEARRQTWHRIGAAVQVWRDIVDAPQRTPSPTLRAILREMQDGPSRPSRVAFPEQDTDATAQAAGLHAALNAAARRVEPTPSPVVYAAMQSRHTTPAPEGASVKESSVNALPKGVGPAADSSMPATEVVAEAAPRGEPPASDGQAAARSPVSNSRPSVQPSVAAQQLETRSSHPAAASLPFVQAAMSLEHFGSPPPIDLGPIGQQISADMTRTLRAIRDAHSDVDVRLDMLNQLIESLVEAVKTKRVQLASLRRDAESRRLDAKPATFAPAEALPTGTEPRSGRDPGAGGPTVRESGVQESAAEPASERAIPNSEPQRPVTTPVPLRMNDAEMQAPEDPAVSPRPSPLKPEASRAPSNGDGTSGHSAKTEPSRTRDHGKRDVAGLAPADRIPAAPVAPAVIEPSWQKGATAESHPAQAAAQLSTAPPEDAASGSGPDEKRRLEEYDEAVKKRRKLRKAVLGRRNKGRER